MRLRLLTYNIHKAIGVDRRFDPDRILAVLAHHDADVLLLQEVDRGAPRSRHMDLAMHLQRALKMTHRAVGMNVFLKKGQYGNATLSRFLVGRQRNIDLTVGRTKRRGAQHARIHMKFGRARFDVDVFNVHLSLTSNLRRTQVDRLLGIADIAAEGDNPVIVGGDMNDWSGQLNHRFAEAGFRCATNRHHHSRRAIKTFPSFAPTTGLDKIFYRGPLRLLHARRSRLRLARTASDHLPVICDFEAG